MKISRRLKIIISEHANLFHFIYNLTDWHFSVRLQYKEKWLKETDLLTSQEQDVLEKIEKVFQKYSFGPNYWGKIFLVEQEKQAWKLAQNQIASEDLKIFRLAANTFHHRFQQIWKKEKYLLVYWKEVFKNINNLIPNGLTADLDTFFEAKPDNHNITVILLLGGHSQAPAGGANIQTGTITLEISWVCPDILRPVILTIWHELVHSLWQSKKFWGKLDTFINKNKSILPEQKLPIHAYLNEGIVASLFPYGYLAEKHFAFPLADYFQKNLREIKTNKSKSLNHWGLYSSYHLHNLSKEYVENRRAVDDNFIKAVLDLLIKYLKDK